MSGEPRAPSVALKQQADRSLLWGVASIVLGWTIVVPILGLRSYSWTVDVAGKESVPTPTRATIGAVLCLLFGVVQSAGTIGWVIRHG